MERQQLIHFQKVAQLNNMSRAAKELNTTQPALSKSIARLESELSMELFQRTGKQLRLNDDGREVLEHVDIILSEINHIYGIASRRKEAKRVHILAMAADQLIPELVFRFHEKYPDVKVQVSHYDSGRQTPDITITSSLERYTGEDGLTVLQEGFVLVVPAGHPLAGRESVELADLKNEPLITLSEGIPLRKIILHWLQGAGITPSFGYECDSCGMMRELINSGRGAGLVPAKTWHFPYNEEIRILPVRDSRCCRYVNVICGGARQSAEAADMYRFMVSYLEKYDIGGTGV